MAHRRTGTIPILAWLASYQKQWLRPDVIAGLTTAAVVIPKAMAYATVAGLPVQVGIYTAFVPMVVYALLGTSRSNTAPPSEVIGAASNRATTGRRPKGCSGS